MRYRILATKPLVLVALAVGLVLGFGASAAAVIPPPGPSSGSTGLQGKISSPPPSSAPSIATPGNGQSFTSVPITVSGLCSSQTVKIFDTNVFVGAVQCTNGSYRLKVDLFSGKNDLVARQYDALGQQSPDSNKVSVTFVDAQFAAFGTRVTLTSPYARIGANPGDTLSWPIIISGGNEPYAVSVDWGDDKPASLQSVAAPGTINIQHVYDTAGTYSVIIKATDKNGTVAFLQLVGVANGAVTAKNANKNSVSPSSTTKVLWWPAAVLVPLIIIGFFLGRRQQLAAIRRQLEKSRNE